MSHWRLFYHLVWATRGRVPLLAEDEAVTMLERSLKAICREHRLLIHAIGTMPDHVHLAVSIPPTVAISSTVQHLKGESSHLLNKSVFADGQPVFSWQAEYGVYSFSERSLPEVVQYVRDQHRRHANSQLWSSYEIVERPYARQHDKDVKSQ
jgi:putative transposase